MILQIILGSSVVLNSFLLIFLFGLIPFLLFFSILINVGTMVYIFFLLGDRNKTYSDFSSLLLRCENFINHLKDLYELEMYYGDETLEALIEHSKDMINHFYAYEDMHYSIDSDEAAQEKTGIEKDDINDDKRDQNQEDTSKETQE